MPTRLIREGILNSERVEKLDWASEVFYRRLMSKVDDHGLYDARSSILRASLYPLRLDRVREADISRWLAECEKAGLIALYSAGGKPYLKMLDTNWQTRSEAKHPLPPENIRKQLQTPVHLVVDGVGVEGDTVRATPGFDRFWEVWPAGERKQARGRCLEVWRKRGFEVDATAVLAHVESAKRSADWLQGFVPAPLVYLNQRRWEGADTAPKARKVAL